MFFNINDIGLKTLDATHNQIHTLPDDLGNLRHLECLYLRHNRLTLLPNLESCIALKVGDGFLVLYANRIVANTSCLIICYVHFAESSIRS